MGIFNKSGKKASDEKPEHRSEGVKYQCPMKCEGDKMYDQPGRCPVCKMYLEEVKQ